MATTHSSRTTRTQPYQLTATFQAGNVGGVETESNDTRATASVLTIHVATHGQLLARTDIDYFAFTATGAGVLSLSFDRPDSGTLGYYVVAVEGADGALLATTRDHAGHPGPRRRCGWGGNLLRADQQCRQFQL